MLTAHLVAENHPWVRRTQMYCAARVGLRVFGIGSVCIAVTMALERYLALTRPFLYHKVRSGQRGSGLKSPNANIAVEYFGLQSKS